MDSKQNRQMALTSKICTFFLVLMLVVSSSQSYATNIKPFTPQEKQDIALLARTAEAFAAIVKRVKPAVVFIQVEKTIKTKPTPVFPFSPFKFFFGPSSPFGQQMPFPQFPQLAPRHYKEIGQGSGFIISPNGYILTNNHVVAGADKITVKLSDGRVFKAKVIGRDPLSDVAVIKIKAKHLPTIPLGDSDKLKVGEWVIAIGNPFGLSQTVTVGVVSAKGRSGIGLNDYEDFIQTDAAINPGNSGGPLINIYGQAVGMNTAIYSKSGGFMGIGFAIPINMVKIIKDQLIKYGKVTRGWLGVVIQNVTEDLAQEFGLPEPEGALVSQVEKDSPAYRAGIKAGDVIIYYNGKKVKNISELRNMVALTKPGTWVKIIVMRNGHQKTLRVKIGELSSANTHFIPRGVTHKLLNELGFNVQNLTPDLAEQFGYKIGQGVLISQVQAGSPADQAGLKPGDLIMEVNRHRVHNVRQFFRALALSAKTKRFLFMVRSGQFNRFVAISLQ